MKATIEHLLEIVDKQVTGKKVPVVDLIAVQTKDPFKVLVATILSARTKDETTAKAASRLFKHAPNHQSLAQLSEEKIAKLIYHDIDDVRLFTFCGTMQSLRTSGCDKRRGTKADSF